MIMATSKLYYREIGRKIAKSDESKEIYIKEKKQRLKESNFHSNGYFDFLTACHKKIQI